MHSTVDKNRRTIYIINEKLTVCFLISNDKLSRVKYSLTDFFNFSHKSELISSQHSVNLEVETLYIKKKV